MYIDTFKLPVEEEEAMVALRIKKNGGYIDNAYPCGIFTECGLSELSFAPVTILYGGNGSGKSTLLNLIAAKLKLNRIAPFNSSELFDEYAGKCEYTLGYDDEGFEHRIPDGSRIITSDDIFDYMLTARTNNEELADGAEAVKAEWGDYGGSLKFGPTIKMNSLDDYEAVRLQVLSRKKSMTRRKFISRFIGDGVKLNSNGETALSYFEQRLKNERLYCLDEPENSLSPKLQLELVKLLSELARYCGCQLVIATHSPFILSLDGARIYDLDARPCDIKKWYELENVRIYADFFNRNREYFSK